MYEYVIWGYANGSTYEQLLVADLQGEKITERKLAEKTVKLLETKYNCKNCRIQEVNLYDNQIKMV